MVKVEVEGVVLNLATYIPVVILRTKKEDVLPIVVGIFEAKAILLVLENTVFSRPLTHDLTKHMVECFGGKMLRLEIHTLRENVYYADILLEIQGKIKKIDCRPSDGIALALRFKSPIFASEDLLEKGEIIKYYESKKFIKSNKLNEPIDKKESEEFRKVIENLSTHEFWKKLKEE